MNIENERKLFENWHFNKYYVKNADRSFLYEMYETKDEYISYEVQHSWTSWQASANREGFVLVPTQATEEMKNSMYDEDGMYIDEIDGTPESFYKAMIKASQENKDD